jgi:putative component of toxin-antitoxin plasmid stabilization module|tara:strand:+ start:508 stop:759 length:252 start_codon:yes stop_codon:yes gene_type:complete
MLEQTIKDLNDPIQSVREDALRYMMKFDAWDVCRDNNVDEGVAAKFFEITYKVASEDKGIRRQKAVMDGVKELRRTVIEGYRI